MKSLMSVPMSLLVALAFSLPATLPPPAWAICGDGTVDSGEDCDDGDTAFAAGESCSAECSNTRCGQTTGSAGAVPIATDALFALRSVVGLEVCDACVCDTDASGDATASDVLRILAAAVGQDITLACNACSMLVRQGSLSLLPILHIPPTPAEVRATLLAQQTELEALGYVVAPDGSSVGWPEMPARGWLVRMGDRLTLSDADGAFTVTLNEGDATIGSIAHPQQPDAPLFELRADQLGRLEADAVEFEIEVEFNGGCGMNDDPAFPDPAACNDLLAQTSPSESHRHHDLHHDHDHAGTTEPPETGHTVAIDTRAFSETDPSQAQRSEALGTYPLGNQNCCRQYDGIGDGDTTTALGVVTNYIGSTCARLVNDGCCAGELGSFTASALKTLGLVEPISCKRNHKGRYCQEVTQGNLVGRVRESIVGPSSNHDVTLGETIDITIHNNACFGETFVEKTHEEIFGVLSGSAYSGDRITHFDGVAPLEMYVADRDLTYVTPRCTTVATGNEQDVYTFAADGAVVTMRFILDTQNLWRFTEDGSVFDGERYPPTPPTDQCPDFHLTGTHPCNDAPDPGGPCGQGAVERLLICGDGVITPGEDCEPGMDAACPGECDACDCPGTVCGNNVVEPGEECDGSGLPGCTEVCLLDCTCIECGNGRIDPTEECDGGNLGGATCESLQLASGTLSCSENCFFDTTACLDPEPTCGNSIPDPGEECDDGNDIDTDGCRNDCTLGFCGDDIVDLGEQCDGDNFFCHGGTCLQTCECDNECATNAECGADLCLSERCVTACAKRSDCDAEELCIAPFVTEGGDLQVGCSPAYSGEALVGERCETGEACESFSCYEPTGECSEFCSVLAGGDEECPGGACLEVVPGTDYGLCATTCGSEADCDDDQYCQLVADSSEDEYDGACGLPFGGGDLGETCATGTDCNTYLCFSPPADPGLCSTNDQCGSDAFCTNFFVCAQPTCTQYCESNSDCGGTHSVCKSTPFPSPAGNFSGSKMFCAKP